MTEMDAGVIFRGVSARPPASVLPPKYPRSFLVETSKCVRVMASVFSIGVDSGGVVWAGSCGEAATRPRTTARRRKAAVETKCVMTVFTGVVGGGFAG